MSDLKFADDSRTALDIRLVPFGGSINGRDTSREFFSAKSNLCLDWFPDRRPLLYHHGKAAGTEATPIGYIESVELKTDGAWARAQLDAHHQYYSEIAGLIDQNALGASSGAMGHLVKVNKSTGHIDQWPLVEGSLTPTPCEPLLATVDWDTAKSHYKSAGLDVDALQTLWQQAGSAESKAAAMVDDTEEAPEGSYEDLMDDLQEALNPKTPWAMGGYSSIMATFPDHVIVCRYDYDGDCTYWDIPYSYENDTITLGTAREVEQTYVPAKSHDGACNLALDALSLSRHAAGITQRTKDMRDTRLKINRQLSTANRTALLEAKSKSLEVAQAIDDLLESNDQAVQAVAKAAYLESPEALALEIELLELIAV